MILICPIVAGKGPEEIQMRDRRLTSTIPDELKVVLFRVGEDISVARRVRRMSQSDLAGRINVTRKLISRMEKGDPTVSFGAYAVAAWVMGLSGHLLDIFSPDRDPVFRREVRLGLPKRIKAKRVDDEDLDF